MQSSSSRTLSTRNVHALFLFVITGVSCGNYYLLWFSPDPVDSSAPSSVLSLPKASSPPAEEKPIQLLRQSTTNATRIAEVSPRRVIPSSDEYLIHFYNGTRDCRILAETNDKEEEEENNSNNKPIRYLGGGSDGSAFLMNFECNRMMNDNDDEIATRSLSYVVKIATRPILLHQGITSKAYEILPKTDKKQKERLYHLLQDAGDDILEHLKISIGEIALSRPILHSMIALSRNELIYNSSEPVVVASVMEPVPTPSNWIGIIYKNIPSANTKRNHVRDLIKIYRAMVSRGFMHNDIRSSNVLVSQRTNRVYLIDFDRLLFVPYPSQQQPVRPHFLRARERQMQQLLALVGTACDETKHFPIPDNLLLSHHHSQNNETKFREQLESAIQKCEFRQKLNFSNMEIALTNESSLDELVRWSNSD